MVNQGIISTPVGAIHLESSDIGLRMLKILSDEDAAHIAYGHDRDLTPVVEQIHRYFACDLQEFNIALDMTGYPEFYIKVWKVLRTIPYGRTRSYSQIARFLQNPNRARAVGNASSHNPLAIIIPCHRVIGKNGRLTGYAYGKNIKRKLLQLESPGHYANQGKLWERASVSK